MILPGELRKYLVIWERINMERILKILSELRPEVDFNSEVALIDDGILDSFDMVALVTELNEEFDVRIGIEELVPENFNSVCDIMKLIERLQEEG